MYIHGSSHPQRPEACCAACCTAADHGWCTAWLVLQVSQKYSGTVTHMPPELIEDGKVYQQGDVYAFGEWQVLHSIRRHEPRGLTANHSRVCVMHFELAHPVCFVPDCCCWPVW